MPESVILHTLLVLVKWVRDQGKWGQGIALSGGFWERGTTGRAGRMAEMASPCSEPRNLVLRETEMTEGTALARDIEAMGDRASQTWPVRGSF